MLGYIIKFGFLILVIMVSLNIFSPENADKVLSTFSEYSEINKDTLKTNLDKATLFTKDTIAEVSQTVNEKLKNWQ